MSDLATIRETFLEFAQHAIDRTAGNHGEFGRREAALASVEALLTAQQTVVRRRGSHGRSHTRVLKKPSTGWTRSRA